MKPSKNNLGGTFAGLVLVVAISSLTGCKESPTPPAAAVRSEAQPSSAEQKSVVSGQIVVPNCTPPDCRSGSPPTSAAAVPATPPPAGPTSSGAIEQAQLKLDREFRSLLYAVFFRFAVAELGPNGRNTVANLVSEALKAERIVLTGRTDPSGDPGKNKMLAQRRADAVKNAFSRQGVESTIIETRLDTSGNPKLEAGTVTPLLPKIEVLRARRVDIFIETPKEAQKS